VFLLKAVAPALLKAVVPAQYPSEHLSESLANCLRVAQLADEHSLIVTKSLVLSVLNDKKAIMMFVG
jgi:hypothetical protein